jgi:8-oxo-dGTP pyrophosphatase MutT (NUDIX family)
MKIIKKAGAIIIVQGKLLLCKPYAFDDLILPGGIIEETETPQDALVRELNEELSKASLPDPESVSYFGTYTDIAAGRLDTLVEIQCFTVSLNGEAQPEDEIKELIFFAPTDNPMVLSPIIRNHILPALVRRGLFDAESNKDDSSNK